MSFTDRNGTQWRNLVEQVLKNKEDINALYRGELTLADFGIKIVNVDNSGEAPVDPPELIEGDTNAWGYAWLVRNTSDPNVNYNLYVWTRDNEGDGFWLFLGEFPAKGPQGPQGIQGQSGSIGPKGPQGERGNTITYSTSQPTGLLKKGDLWISGTDIYTYTGTQWSYIGSTQGPQGATGPQGSPGLTPRIINGYWVIGDTHTGIKAEGEDGQSLVVQSGVYTVATLPNFNTTTVGQAFIVSKSEGHDLYFHGYGGVDWTIVADWGQFQLDPLITRVETLETDLKPHAFNDLASVQSAETNKAPTNKLLKESSFARVYREATELSGVTYPISIENLLTAIIAANPLNSMFIIGVNNATETKVTGLPSTYGALTIIVPGETSVRMRVEFSKEIGNDTALIWVGSLTRSGTTITEVTWKQIIDDSSAQTISGVKTFTASPIVPTTPSGPSAAVSKTYADSVGFARVYREATEISGITYPVAIGVLCKELSDRNLLNTYMVIGCSAATEDKITGLPKIGEAPQTYGQLIIRVPGTSALRMDIEYTKHTGTGTGDIKWIGDLNRGTTPWTVNWKQIIDDGSAQIITGVKTFATGATPLITDAPTTDLMAVNKEYVDGTIDILQATINGLLSRIVALESSGGDVYFTKSRFAVSITATQDGNTVTTGFTGVSSKVIVMTLTKPADETIWRYKFSGWTKDGIPITSGSDGFVIETDTVNNTQTLTFTYGTGKDGTYQGNVTRYTSPPIE